MKDGAAIVYDTVLRDGSNSAFAVKIGADGNVVEMPVPPQREMPTTFWRMARHMRADRAFSETSLLEDSPFYARTLLKVETEEGMADAFHESLSLARFRSPVVQMMLPFRMPRRG
jgi:carotenoid 1,2-hydratase